MDERQPADDDPFNDDVYVRAWWQRYRHLHGTGPHARAAAAALDWAHRGVADHGLHSDPESAVTLVHRLLHAPGADAEAVAELPLQDLLEWRGPEVEHDIAGLCAEDALWRQALGFVTLTDEQRSGVPALAPFLI